jgi:hypothetical protein
MVHEAWPQAQKMSGLPAFPSHSAPQNLLSGAAMQVQDG